MREHGVLSVRDVDIVRDLSTPIPQLLKSSVDFIVGALSDLFSPTAALQSYAAMLRPGGRFLAINNLSGHFDHRSIEQNKRLRCRVRR
jgi:hypothetical protein